MKAKRINLIGSFALIAFILFFNAEIIKAQYQTTCRVNNYTVLNANQFSFKIYLKNISSNSLEYASGQYYVNFNSAILNGGTGSVAILNSELPVNLRPRNPVVSGSEIQLRTNTPPGAGFGQILNINDSILIAEVRFSTSATSFTTGSTSNIAWKLTGSGFVTKYSAYIGTVNTQIESQSTFGLNENNDPLPVELVSFSGNVDKRSINLKFTTSKEINNKGFEILRKSENTDWEKVGYLEGKGNSDVKTDYSFNDNRLNVGKYNYKLKQMSYNGDYRFFNLKTKLEVGPPTKFELYQNYPNPFNPSTRIEFDVPYDAIINLVIYDVTGRKINMLLENINKTAGYYSINFTDNNLSSGIYFYRFTAISNKSKYSLTKRMVVLK